MNYKKKKKRNKHYKHFFERKKTNGYKNIGSAFSFYKVTAFSFLFFLFYLVKGRFNKSTTAEAQRGAKTHQQNRQANMEPEKLKQEGGKKLKIPKT